MSTYKASIYNYIFNSINSIIFLVNGIVMVPLYFHYMPVSTYGAWLATGNVVAMLGLLESGFSSVITQKMAAAIGAKDRLRFGYLAGANIITAILIASAILLLGLIIAPFITGWINVASSVSSEIQVSYIVALIASSIAICVSLFNAFPQVWQDTKTTGLINLCTGLVAIVALVAFLLMGFGVVSIAISYLVRAIANLLFQGMWIIKKWKREKFQKPLFSLSESRTLAKDCVFPFLSRLSGVIMGNSQSFIIAHFMSPTLSAIYDLTAKVCIVACGFVSQTNGSFFALFSLTLSSGDKGKINSVFQRTNSFFIISLSAVGVYSICFSEPILNYWVGLDKFGGTPLLILIVLSSLLYQMRLYCNNILYTGGLINKSAKLDILCAAVYIVLLLSLIKVAQIYTLPLATLLVSTLFILWYIRLIKKHIALDVSMFYKDFVKATLIIVPFVLLHFILAPDYQNLKIYVAYMILFSGVFMASLYVTNKEFFSLLLSRVFHKKVS